VTVGVRVVHPALQMQLVKAALPAGELEFDGQALHVELAEDPTAVEYVPAAQSLQTAEPVDALYLPASHAVHVPPSGPENPALQVQFVKEVLPTGALEVPAVKSTPRTMRSAMAEVAPVLRYSSTTKTPAMSPLKQGRGLLSGNKSKALAIQVLDAALSVTAVEAVPVKILSFTVNQYSLVDARYLATTVNQASCTIPPDETIDTTTSPPLFLISNPTSLLVTLL
jgi:hypothetical protein